MADMPSHSFSAEISRLEGKWRNRSSAVICARLADLLRRAARINDAERVALEGLAKWQGNSSIKIVLGRCYRDLKKYDDAVGVFRDVLEAQPRNLVALKSIAEIAFTGKDWKTATDAFEDYLFEQPGDDEARGMLEEAESKKSASLLLPVDEMKKEQGAAESDEPDSRSSVFPDTGRMQRVLKSQGIENAGEKEGDRRMPKTSGIARPAQNSNQGSLLSLFLQEEIDRYKLRPYDEEAK